MYTTSINDTFQAYDDERLASLSGSTALTSTLVTPTDTRTHGFARKAFITNDGTVAVHFNILGETADTDDHKLAAGASITIVGYVNIQNLRFIENASGGVVVATYFR